MRNQKSIEELNRIKYSEYYRKESLESYGIYKKTQLILKILKVLNINLQNKRILDIGFGTGSTLLNLSQKNSKLYGIEYIKEACYHFNSKIKETMPGLQLLLASTLKLPFKNSSFDIIICSHILEHIKEDNLAIMEIWRVLCHQGTLIFLTPNENYGGKEGLHFRTYSFDDLENLIKNRFEIIYRLKYRSFIDNFLYKIPIKFEVFNKILTIFSFLDLFFASTSPLKNLEDLYVLIKKPGNQ